MLLKTKGKYKCTSVMSVAKSYFDSMLLQLMHQSHKFSQAETEAALSKAAYICRFTADVFDLHLINIDLAQIYCVALPCFIGSTRLNIKT